MTTWRALRAWVLARPVVADALLAGALFVGQSLLWVFGPRSFLPPDWTASDWSGALAWSLLGLAPVAVRRRWPWLAVAAVSLHTAVGAAIGLFSEGLAILVLTYTVTAYLPLRWSAAATALIWLPGLTLATVFERYEEPHLSLTPAYFLLFNAMMALVAFLAGRTVFTRRRYVAALVERARAAEQNQQALSAQAVAEERRRIARELHDMVAHHVSVMGVLATASRRTLRRDPDAADEALATIEETGRSVLREMRRLLDVLRTEPERDDPLAPQPGLAGLAGLVEQVREAGLAVTLTASGGLDGADGTDMDPGVALTVYRIVQEALTNVLKHGGSAARAEVRLDVGDHWLVLEVFDTGRGPGRDGVRADAIGHGLLGMRERVALYGGTLRTGARPGGGFRVYARIPVKEDGHG